MIYTHTFEFKIDGVLLEGQIAFDDMLHFKIDGDLEMNCNRFQKIMKVFQSALECKNDFGTLQSMEIHAKP